MMRTLLIEFHGWRGVSADRDLFVRFAVLGFVTVGISRHQLTERLRRLMTELWKLKDRDHA